MPIFLWEGKDRSNTLQKGEMMAASEEKFGRVLTGSELYRPRLRRNRRICSKMLLS
jgi:hypothetical protein